MTSGQEMEPTARDNQRVRQSFRACLVAFVLAGIAVAPWVAHDFLLESGEDGKHDGLVWLFYISGVPLLLIAGVYYVESLVYGFRVIGRRPVVWLWFVASWVLLVAWGVFALMFLD
jgi:hypothetical protein